MTMSKALFVTMLILLNAVPVYGVFAWQWQSFDLIFLYWLENLIIGVFTVIRFIARPYQHPIDAIIPLFMAPFFAFHYGMFCYGHGTFIIGLFGKDLPENITSGGVFNAIIPVIASNHLFWPVAALFAYQLLDWIRDTYKYGLGGDGIKDLMTAPYRRIIVLHITIIASGFALSALDEPVSGLIILIVLKVIFDIYHWNKDEKGTFPSDDLVIDQKMKQKIDQFIESPYVKINGETTHYNNFSELKASKHYKLMRSIFRIMGGNRHIGAIEAYIEERIKNKADNTKNQDT